MQKYKYILVFCFCWMAFLNLMAQHNNEDLVQFSGVIVTSDSLVPISFSHIINGTSGFGTISDFYGYFSFVAHKNDTIRFSALGYKDEVFVIPDTITKNRYTLFQVMTTDTIYLSETIIYPWPTKEDFKEAFLNLDIPDDDYQLALRNLEQSELRERSAAMNMDGSENYQNYIDNTISKYYYAGQIQPITILNPFAWAKFIKAWKEGKFKKQKN